MLCYFIVLFSKPFYIHILLIIANLLMILYNYSLLGKISLNVLFWCGLIIIINLYWLYQDIIHKNKYHTSKCNISHHN